jgi:retron-type reverse transcriptase
VDTDHRTDKVWVLGIQSKLYQWSKANPDDLWRDMWGWLTDLRVLRQRPAARCLQQRWAHGRGRRDDGGAYSE